MTFEPWTPEDGQRVRVRLSPECPGAASGLGWKISHTPEINGRVGTVDMELSDMYKRWAASNPSQDLLGLCYDPAHPWIILFDRQPSDRVQIGAAYSVWELEPIRD